MIRASFSIFLALMVQSALAMDVPKATLTEANKFPFTGRHGNGIEYVFRYSISEDNYWRLRPRQELNGAISFIALHKDGRYMSWQLSQESGQELLESAEKEYAAFHNNTKK